MSPEVAALLTQVDEAHAASTPWFESLERLFQNAPGKALPGERLADAAAIVALHNAWPALAAELRRQDTALKAVEALADGLPFNYPDQIRAALAAGDDGQATERERERLQLDALAHGYLMDDVSARAITGEQGETDE